MKKLLIVAVLTFIIVSCSKTYKPREAVTISIEKFPVDSTSIRAIEVLNDTALVYAGSNGAIGLISGSKHIPIATKIITDSVVQHFRSLAFTNDAIYALNIGNPALLYQFRNNTIEIVYKEENEKVFYDSMKFFDELNGIAMGDPTEDCLSVLITRDGGESWGKIPCKFLPKIEPGEAAFAASNTNITIVGENAWIATGGKKARVFHTSDMGLTWNVYETPIIQGKETTGIYSIAFYSENEGIICGGDYTNKFGNSINKAITFNGGKTWKVVAENEAPKYVSCVQYVPNTEGNELFAVSTNGIFYSNNKGENWEKVSDEGFFAIRFATKNIAWLSGENTIAKMTIK
jgi:photosystem II stability/assembly factor-like uncharacterized protein